MWNVKPGEVLAASFSEEQSSRTEGKAIPTQRSVLSHKAHLPPLLLMKQLETVTLGAAQHGEPCRGSTMKNVLVWHTIRCSEGGEFKHLVEEHQSLNLDTFSALLAPFLYIYMLLFKRDLINNTNQSKKRPKTHT